MVLPDRHIQEAVRHAFPNPLDCPPQRSLALLPCLAESVGFFQVCCLASAARMVTSHQFRMVYQEEFGLWFENAGAFLLAREVPREIRSFFLDTWWDDRAPGIDRFTFHSMQELILLTFIAEERGYSVWNRERCEAFYYRFDR
ncbi:MAG: hypothetical protein FJY97_03025 [candidate division Zixibacteria bacterium]|nr:hypothetical protein [candidate division Zixibacteria bacterium]